MCHSSKLFGCQLPRCDLLSQINVAACDPKCWRLGCEIGCLCDHNFQPLADINDKLSDNGLFNRQLFGKYFSNNKLFDDQLSIFHLANDQLGNTKFAAD